jgi:hypothetical protein
MKVQFINNDGAGFADDVQVDEGTSAEELFVKKMGDADPGSYLIRINRLAASANQILHAGDKMSVTPTKIKGASNRK